MEIEEIVLFLRQVLPFSQLPLAEVQRMVQTIQVQTFDDGQDILVYGGKPAMHLYIVCQGRVDLVRDEGIQQVVVDTLEEGEIFGHPSLIRRRPPVVTSRAHGWTMVYMLPAAKFHQLMRDYPVFGSFVTMSAIERLGNTFEERHAGFAPVLFQTRLRDLEQHRLITIAPDATVREAAQLMRDYYLSSLIVDVFPPGIITDRDLRSRVLAAGLPEDTPVSKVMSAPARTLASDRLVFEALMLMLQHRFHHIPVTEDGRVTGIITDTDILRQQSHSPLFLPDQLRSARSLTELREYTNQVTVTVGALLDAGARISDIGQVVAVAHDALLVRLLREAEHELGPPPCPYAWLVLGSEGRYEQTLRTDQDNALVYADNAPRGAEIYFTALAERIVESLVAVGFPRCPGNVMATNPEWRQPLSVWEGYFRRWIRLPEEEALMRVGIFFDYRRIYGDLDIDTVLRPVIEAGAKEHVFLGRLARTALRQSPPIGFFRQFVVEKHGNTRDLIDLKERGTALIVDLARLFSLESGRAATSTLTRLHQSAGQSSLSETGAEELAEAFEYISLLRLRYQYQLIERGQEPSNQMPVSRLSKRQQRELKDAYRAVARIQESVAAAFQTNRMG